jgi:hypothetical protein
VKDKFRYIVVGSLDDPEALPPKGEFFCKDRVSWMPEVPSKSTSYAYLGTQFAISDCKTDVFHKKEIKE